ncbi:MAG: DUF1013 domain-containing protein [Rickettsiales bacterium]|jgi:hypothetical protein|nr:DUF1013 domain-containing protein [Rickettsiales bacterium]
MAGKVPLMRRATAMWLIENTALTFEQIAEFCDIHILEIQGMADGDVANDITPSNPIDSNQLTREMVEICEKDSARRLEVKQMVADEIIPKKKSRKDNTYVPFARRGDKPDAILYLLKSFPEMTNRQIRRLINTTTPMIESIRNKTHWNIKEIKSRDPVLLGLCSQSQFNSVVKELENGQNEANNT